MSQAWQPGYSLDDEEFQLTRIQDYAVATMPPMPEGTFCLACWEDWVANRAAQKLMDRRYYEGPEMHLCKDS